MINNRQGGRRRGRGGQRNQNLGQPGSGRQDNRQRGNAAQLLEKYKNMARDAQLAGDRVQSEYYLQFAEHYYRVLGESRARFEEQRRQRGEDDPDDYGGDESMDSDEQQADQDSDEDRPQRRDAGERRERRPRVARDNAERGDRNGSRHSNGSGGDGISMDVLPPAIGTDEIGAEDSPDEEESPRPRRRVRRPRASDTEGEVAPAA